MSTVIPGLSASNRGDPGRVRLRAPRPRACCGEVDRLPRPARRRSRLNRWSCSHPSGHRRARRWRSAPRCAALLERVGVARVDRRQHGGHRRSREDRDSRWYVDLAAARRRREAEGDHGEEREYAPARGCEAQESPFGSISSPFAEITSSSSGRVRVEGVGGLLDRERGREREIDRPAGHGGEVRLVLRLARAWRSGAMPVLNESVWRPMALEIGAEDRRLEEAAKVRIELCVSKVPLG